MRSAYGLDSGTDVDWLLAAACRGHDPSWWETAAYSNHAKQRQNRIARKICRECPVKRECLKRADELGAHGMIVAGQAWKSPAKTRYVTAGISAMCQRVGCRNTFTGSSNGRKRFCSANCKQSEYYRLNGRKRAA